MVSFPAYVGRKGLSMWQRWSGRYSGIQRTTQCSAYLEGLKGGWNTTTQRKFGIQNEVYYHLLGCSYSTLHTHCQGCSTPLRSMWCTPSFWPSPRISSCTPLVTRVLAGAVIPPACQALFVPSWTTVSRLMFPKLNSIDVVCRLLSVLTWNTFDDQQPWWWHIDYYRTRKWIYRYPLRCNEDQIHLLWCKPVWSGVWWWQDSRTLIAKAGICHWPPPFKGVLGTDYTWPSPTSVDFFVGQGFNAFRIPFMLERLVPPASGMTGTFDSAYFSGLKTVSSFGPSI